MKVKDGQGVVNAELTVPAHPEAGPGVVIFQLRDQVLYGIDQPLVVQHTEFSWVHNHLLHKQDALHYQLNRPFLTLTQNTLFLKYACLIPHTCGQCVILPYKGV